MNAEKFFTNRYGVIAAAVAATFLWGSAFPFIKLSYSALDIHSDETAEQLLFAGYRFFIASLLIIIFFMLLKRDMKIKQGTVIPLIKLGALQTFFQYILFYIGLSYSTGIQGSIIAGSTSFFQILFAHFLYKDDALSIRKGIGLVIGFTGVILVNLTKGSLELKFGIGELFLMGAMMISAFGNIYARGLSRHMPVPYLTAYQMLFGSVALLAASITSAGIFPFDFNLSSGLILFYLAFLSAAGFVLWNNVMKYNKVGKVSMYLFLVPVFGVFLSALLLGEAVHSFVLLGLVLVALGIVIVNRQPSV